MSDNIRIGKRNWIKWIDFDFKLTEPKRIDSLLEPTIAFWTHIEIECVAGCCGIHAFSFLKEDIQIAAQKSGIKDLKALFDTIINEIKIISDDVVVISQLNQLINRNVFLELLEHIKTNL